LSVSSSENMDDIPLIALVIARLIGDFGDAVVAGVVTIVTCP
jgi:hypothetical protein